MRFKNIEYETIVAAHNQDQEAMDAVLAFFDRYINFRSLRECVDDHGNKYMMVNQDVRDRIQQKIIYALIYKYDPTKLPESETLEL